MKIASALFDLDGFSPLVADRKQYSSRLHIVDELPLDLSNAVFAVSSEDIKSEYANSFAARLAETLAFATGSIDLPGEVLSLAVTSREDAGDDIDMWRRTGRLLYDDSGEPGAILGAAAIENTGSDLYYAGHITEQLAQLGADRMLASAEHVLTLSVKVSLGSLTKRAGAYSHGMHVDLSTATGGNIADIGLPASRKLRYLRFGDLEDAGNRVLMVTRERFLMEHEPMRAALQMEETLRACADIWRWACLRAEERFADEPEFKNEIKATWWQLNDSARKTPTTRLASKLGEMIDVWPLLDACVSGVPLPDIMA